MDLTSATPDQKRIITTLDAPLSVAAGAGSGKTFTLTNRIAYALVGEAGAELPYINSVDEVLAITFSRSGAAELKSRIRTLLQEEGLDDQARAVEDAWVSTIHGMCARILREHALELGIDPGFELVEDVESKALWQQALESVLKRWAEEDDAPRIKRLIEWFPEQETARGSSGIETYLTDLWGTTLGLPKGFESVYIPETEIDLEAALQTLVTLGERFKAISEGWEEYERHEPPHLEKLDYALDRATAYMQRVDLSQASFLSDDFDMQECLDVLLSFPKTYKTHRSNDPESDFFVHYRETYYEIARAVVLNAACVLSADLLELLKLVDYEYQSLKGPGRLDNTDLLRACCDALELYPDLRESYQRQFKLIMVDEFQDTDLLQVAIIDNLSRDHGANVMTVGDAQQSIYRFRGADVEVFFRHRNEQREKHDSFQALSLPDNFRSHGDILKFVDAIFSGDAFFGEEFLSLVPRGKINDDEDPLFDSFPRVEVNVLESRSRKSSAADVRVQNARAIAQHFTKLRDGGASPGSMVILLGSMGNADIYSRALADEGFECLITAGSVFARKKEVHVVEALLRALADHTNSTALYQVLTSPLFNLSDGALYAISHDALDGEQREFGRAFAPRFWRMLAAYENDGSTLVEQCATSFGLSTAEIAELIRVFALFHDLEHDLVQQGVHDALHALLVDSGWLYRLQADGAEGLAVAANLFKALGFVREWENKHRTLYQIADDFTTFLEVSKQTPGVLATPDSSFVRIMTIHASKGLEFDHVAVAEISSGDPKSSQLRIDTLDDSVLFSLSPKLSTPAQDTYGGLKGLFPVEGEFDLEHQEDVKNLSLSDLSDFLDARLVRGARGDAQRLLYVALTRAVKSLYLCLGFKADAKFDYRKKGIFNQLYEVFEWDKTLDAKTFTFDFDGSKPALVHHEVLLEKIINEDAVSQDEKLFLVVADKRVSARSVRVASDRHNVVSYSSLAPDHKNEMDVTDPDEAGMPITPSFDDDTGEMFPDGSVAPGRSKALALGTAFHRLAQRAIESRAQVGEVPELSESAIEAQAYASELSPEQLTRLQAAIDRWFASDLCARFFAEACIFAEVPFMLKLDTGSEPIYLEGEIDGLALSAEDSTHALLIDYKTGGSSEETDVHLRDKHLLQAQCYALALLRQGFQTIEANFVRVEQPQAENPQQPQVVTYTFTSADQSQLEAAVLAAYHARQAQKALEV